ncbi:hypothetical protein LOZ51_003583 [Ophidiomyces ophidiicola]|nr:hypothetical protein LOZ55_005169 [Ophidiomyces ophidiicola]KAI1981485.1 hypothetical protein LOZ54_005587 [Ophidiomyces ophidiicola]KAI1994395.1 hypothetical protein LOZ51_003583 [Ophidiomyces ophidiicola]
MRFTAVLTVLMASVASCQMSESWGKAKTTINGPLATSAKALGDEVTKLSGMATSGAAINLEEMKKSMNSYSDSWRAVGNDMKGINKATDETDICTVFVSAVETFVALLGPLAELGEKAAALDKKGLVNHNDGGKLLLRPLQVSVQDSVTTVKDKGINCGGKLDIPLPRLFSPVGNKWVWALKK